MLPLIEVLVFALVTAIGMGGLTHTPYWHTLSKIKKYVVGFLVFILMIAISVGSNILYDKFKDDWSESTVETPEIGQVKFEDWKKIDRYIVKDGLVLDTVTNLMWQRCAYGKKGDKKWHYFKFKFECEGKALSMSWDKANELAKLNEYAGFKDWRIPTRNELSTLVYCSNDLPKRWNNSSERCIGDYNSPTTMDAAFPQTEPATFWSSDGYDDGNRYIDVVSFRDGAKEEERIIWTETITIEHDVTKSKWDKFWGNREIKTETKTERREGGFNYVWLVRTHQ